MPAQVVHRSDGTPIGASFFVELDSKGPTSIVVESRGGARAPPGARNLDYAEALELILGRIRDLDGELADAVVESKANQHLAYSERRLVLDGSPYPIAIEDPADLQRRLGASQARVGRQPNAKGSRNRTQRVRLVLSFKGEPPSATRLESFLSGHRTELRYWGLFADPETYRIEAAIKAVDSDAWITSGRSMQRGDHVLIWKGQGRGDRRGVVALGEVMSDPEMASEHENPFAATSPPAADLQPRVKIRYVVPPGLPLWAEDHGDILNDLSVARARGGTVFNITPEQWEKIVAASGGWVPARKEVAVDAAMKIYQVAKCPFAHRARIMLEEKHLTYEVEYFQPRARPIELTQLSPDARSPTLFDSAHDTWVWDSLVVSEYLEERYPEVAMMPADPGGRALARLLMREADTKLHPLGAPIIDELVHKKPAPPDEAKIAAALAQLHAALEPWNARLEHKPFLLGEAFTLADIVLYTPLASLAGLLGERAEPTPALTHLHAWRSRIAARPSTAY